MTVAPSLAGTHVGICYSPCKVNVNGVEKTQDAVRRGVENGNPYIVQSLSPSNTSFFRQRFAQRGQRAEGMPRSLVRHMIA